MNATKDYLNRTFYDMTTLNINDWKTYQHMRILAKTKFDLNLQSSLLWISWKSNSNAILFLFNKNT